MRSSRVLLLIGLATAALVAAPARAQSGPGVQMVMGIGGGPGAAQFRCDDCLSDRERSSSGYLRIGRRIRPAWVVGVEADGWLKENDSGDARTTVGAVDAFVQWYPRQGLFFVGGLGGASIRREFDDALQSISVTIVSEDRGIGWHLGAGYEFQIAEHAALAPFATIFGTRGIEFEDQGGYDSNVFTVGIGLVVN